VNKVMNSNCFVNAVLENVTSYKGQKKVRIKIILKKACSMPGCNRDNENTFYGDIIITGDPFVDIKLCLSKFQFTCYNCGVIFGLNHPELMSTARDNRIIDILKTPLVLRT